MSKIKCIEDSFGITYMMKHPKSRAMAAHRLDGPAVIDKDGSVAYCINNYYHRMDGPARILQYNGIISNIYWMFSEKDGKSFSYEESDFFKAIAK